MRKKNANAMFVGKNNLVLIDWELLTYHVILLNAT